MPFSTSWASVSGDRTCINTFSIRNLGCGAYGWKLPVFGIACLVLSALCYPLVLPLAALSTTILVFCLLIFSTMPQQFGDTYNGFILWIQALHMAYEYVVYRGATVTTSACMPIAQLQPRRRLARSNCGPVPLSVAKAYEEEFSAAYPNILGWQVPVVPILGAACRLLSWSSPPRVADETLFAPSEDPVAYVMRVCSGIYPEVPEVWPSKHSDEALTWLVRSQVGADNIEVLADDAPERAQFGARYAVRTNCLAHCEVREGLESYGGDALFDDDWRVVAIVRQERVPHPAIEGLVTTTAVSYTPSHGKSWAYIKFCFRSSLFSLVTFANHLYLTHLLVSMNMTIATRETLSPDHPVRRFVTPFIYGNITINAWARQALVLPHSTVGRAFAFTELGLQQAWHAVRECLPASKRSGCLPPLAAEEVAPPYCSKYTQSRKQFEAAASAFAGEYLESFYPDGIPQQPSAAGEPCDEVWAWLSHLSESHGDAAAVAAVANGSPTEARDYVRRILARLITFVALEHNIVGNVGSLAQDVSFAAFSWPKGRLSGTKQLAMRQATLMCLTSSTTPYLLATPGGPNDWSYLFPATSAKQRAALAEVFAKFQASLHVLSDELDEYSASVEVAARSFPDNFGMWVTNPRYMRTAVDI